MAKGVNKTLKIKKQITCKQCQGTGAKDSQSVSNCKACNGTGKMKKIQNTFLGTMQTVSICTSCSGLGKIVIHQCNSCSGSGVNYGDETVTIQIPPGVYGGLQINMTGKGNAGEKGGANGDLIVLIEEEKHPELQREGMNIAYDLFLSIPEAIGGCQVEIPSISGKLKIKIPAGTQGGKIFRLKGKGFPELQGYGMGDQLVHVNIWIPQHLTNEEKDLVEKLKNCPNFKPTPQKNEKSFFDKIKDAFQ